MEDVKKPVEPTMEELKEACKKLYEQNKQLYESLQNSNLQNMFKRLDYLFKVLEYSIHFTSEFSVKCANEIEMFMTIAEEEAKEDKEESINAEEHK